MRDIIIEGTKNIGALCRFLRKNLEYLDHIGLNIPIDTDKLALSEKIWYFTNNISELQLCDCGNHLSFIGFKNGYRTTCGDKRCYVLKRKQTSIKNWGVDNPRKSEVVSNKISNTIKEKYNDKHYMHDDKVRNKFKNTMLINHGVEWAQQNPDIVRKSKETYESNPDKERIVEQRTLVIRESNRNNKEEIHNKRRNTIIERYGSMENFHSLIQEKVKSTSFEKYGVEHFLKSKDIIDKRVVSFEKSVLDKLVEKLPDNITIIYKERNRNNTDSVFTINCSECNEESHINRQYLYFRVESGTDPCLCCNPILSGKSNMEIEVGDFIKSYYQHDVLLNSRGLIKNIELDIYLPNDNIAFEFNGLYWHSELYKEKYYHINKTNLCLENGIKLIHIWEDDWVYKQDIVRSRILNLLGNSDKIYARKCDIREVNNFDYRDFLTRNHIQGYVGARAKLGLYFNNELVSVMSFGSLRRVLGQKGKETSWELLRFCNKLGVSVVGGASKLFKYFINNYSAIEIISYSDKCWSTGNLYKQLGFDFASTTDPNYFYIIEDRRSHRFNWRKDKLIKLGQDSSLTERQIMCRMGYNRIYDCGSDKWIFKTY